MIAQHLLMRCKKGYYDSTALAGLKTAAVSDGFKEYSREFQKDIEQEIALATLPDSVILSKSVNRGILRISYIDDVSIISRIFRVADKCDRRGNSNLTHTYIIDEDDRDTLLSSPLCLLNLQAFDNYEDIDSRCGGLINGGKIQINEELDIFSPCKIEGNNMFDTLNITKELFSKMISEVCNVLSDDGYVSVLIPDVDERTWDAEGGSYKGEVFMLSIIQLLPSCLSRFFSGISYWNESDGYYGLDEIKFRISSGRFLNTSLQTDNSVIDFINHSTCPELEISEFGNYLWEIRNNIHEINRFRLFIDDVFGENVDSVSKPARLMDAITSMYKNQNQYNDIMQHTISEFLDMFGDEIILFPKIVEYCLVGLENIALNNVSVSNELQDSMVLNINPNMTRLMYKCLINTILDGTAKDATISFVTDILINRKESQIEDVFKKCISDARTKGISSISDSMFELISKYYIETKTNNKLVKEIFYLLCDTAIAYYEKKLYCRYLQILGILSASIATLSIINASSIYQYYSNIIVKLISIYQSDEVLYTQAIRNILFSHFNILILSNYKDELLPLFESAIFHNELVNSVELCRKELFFELFIVIVPYINIANIESINQWRSFYRKLLSEDYYYFSDSDRFLEMIESKYKRLGLFRTEYVRKCYTNKSSWSKISVIVDLFENIEKKYNVIYSLCNDTSNIDETMGMMSQSDIIYGYILYKAQKIDSNKERQEYIRYISKFVIKNNNFLDQFLSAAQQQINFEETLASIYFSLWFQANKVSGMPNDDVVNMVYEQSNTLEGFKYKRTIMANFEKLFSQYYIQYNDLTSRAVEVIIYGSQYFNWKVNPVILDRLKLRNFIDIVMYKEIIDDNCIISLFNPNNINILKDMNISTYLRNYIDSHTNNINKEVNENIALVALLYILIVPRYDIGYAKMYLYYLNLMEKDTIDWRGAQSIMYGLKYIFKIDNFGLMKTESLKSSFIKVFADNFIKTDGKRNVLKCKSIYVEYVKPYMSSVQKNELGKKAAITQDKDLMDLFPKEIISIKSGVKKLLGFLGN